MKYAIAIIIPLICLIEAVPAQQLSARALFLEYIESVNELKNSRNLNDLRGYFDKDFTVDYTFIELNGKAKKKPR